MMLLRIHHIFQQPNYKYSSRLLSIIIQQIEDCNDRISGIKNAMNGCEKKQEFRRNRT